jgi:DNA-directed RNA polymerase specialized sigma24 family protein
LPDGADADAALRETLLRIGRRRSSGPGGRFDERAIEVAREVAAERRKATVRLPFSDDLFRQLADRSGPPPERIEARAWALAECLHQLPPPERNLLRQRYELGRTIAQIAAADGRPPTTVVRDLSGLHESLLSALSATAPDGGPDPPGGAADLGRLADQLLDGTISDDSRLVLETLLLADAPAQAHYARHAALVTDLTWDYRGAPILPEQPADEPQPAAITRREKLVTVAFVVCCTVAMLVVVFLFTGWLR